MYLTVTVPPPAISDVSQLKRKHEGNPSQEIDFAMARHKKNIPANRTCVPDMAQSSPQELKPPLKLAGILIVEPSFKLGEQSDRDFRGGTDIDARDADGVVGANLDARPHPQGGGQRVRWGQELVDDLRQSHHHYHFKDHFYWLS